MIRIKIDGKEIITEKELTIFQVAERNNISIPVMCYNPLAGHFASCMICVVKEKASRKLLTSCSVAAAEGMDIITDDEEINEARKIALELLLSEHVGDCEAPCRLACPAHMDIPSMNRFLAEGKIDQALNIVRKDIALPSVLGRICPAPCEGACRRKPIDETVRICLLKKFAGDEGKIEMIKAPQTGKKVAIIGSGPAGLAAAYYLELRGIHSVVFDKNDKPGGSLRYDISDEVLEKSVLDKEIDFIKSSGAEFIQCKKIDLPTFEELKKTFDAVVVATGNFSSEIAGWGLAHNEKQVLSDKKTHQTNIPNVFAIGNINRQMKLAVRSAGQGKEVAFSITQLLQNKPVTGEPRMFNSRFGKLIQEEYSVYLSESSVVNMSVPGENASLKDEDTLSSGRGRGRTDAFNLEQTILEASRCMHCDCRKKDDCKLRIFSDQYNARQTRFNYEKRMPVRKISGHDLIIYEPEKCIKCGICVRISQKHKEKFGFTYIGRGFDVEIGAPFNTQLNEAFKETAEIVANACPTGAIAFKKNI